MWPILIEVGPLTIHTYGFMIALGFLAGLYFATRESKRLQMPHDRVIDVGFAAIIAGIIGSRAVYVLTNLAYFRTNPLDMIKIWEGGLVFYGGIVSAIPVAFWVARRKGLPLWQTADVWAPSLALAHSLGRIGCFSAGCCYGTAAPDLPWAVIFTHPETLAIRGVPLHPTQLYESALEFLNFLVLYYGFRKRTSFHGQLFWLYVLNYSMIRTVTEQFRGDEVRGFLLPGISISTAISAVMFIAALAFLFVLRKKQRIQ